MLNPSPGSGVIPSISITYDKGMAKPKMDWFTPHNKSGVGLSDFKKGQGPARSDKQILMGFSEVFAYKDFNESKVKNCIEKSTMAEKLVTLFLRRSRYLITSFSPMYTIVKNHI